MSKDHSTNQNTPLIETIEVQARYGKKIILHKTSFCVKRGEFICIVGPNGSGKSTFLSLLANIDQHGLTKTGEIRLQNENIEKFSRRRLAQNLSFMTQTEHSAWDFSVYDTLKNGRFSHKNLMQSYNQNDENIIVNAMHELDISHLKNRSVHSLSGGEFQKVRIARSLVQKSPLLLLDEPIANVDFSYQHTILQKLQTLAHKKHVGVVIAIHDINAAALFADKIALLCPADNIDYDKKQLRIGTPKEILHCDVLSEAYAGTFTVFNHPIYNCPQICISV
ncbi:MAG: ABC transporter ATP-binding protein [Spirochaetales bacterium]